MLTRKSYKVNGYHRPETGSRGAEEWHFTVGDGVVTLDLEVYTGIYPDGYRGDPVFNAMRGSSVTLHCSFPLKRSGDYDETDGATEFRECELVPGGKCYGSSRFNWMGMAQTFWEDHSVGDRFDQPESFWLALEAKFADLSKLAYADRATADDLFLSRVRREPGIALKLLRACEESSRYMEKYSPNATALLFVNISIAEARAS